MVVKTTLNLIYKLVHKFPFSLDNKQYATQNSFFLCKRYNLFHGIELLVFVIILVY
jgi:hypothetical protein